MEHCPATPVVLVVDDNPDIATYLASLAQGEGCEAIAAYCGRTALDLLLTRKFAMMILDHHMPGLTGLELLEQLRDAGEPPLPPTVVCSADDDARERALELGAVDFVPKDRNVITELGDRLRRYARCPGAASN